MSESSSSCSSSCGCASGSKTSSSKEPMSSTGAVSIQNGKGSAPRNISGRFLKNYNEIRWSSAGKDSKARKDGSKFVKVYSSTSSSASVSAPKKAKKA